MPTLLLIRHGENDYLKKNKMPGRLPGVHLNERGREQANELAQALARMPIKAIYTSPLERAVETAEPLAQTLGLDIRLRPALMDTDVGQWQGRELKKLHRLSLWKQIESAPSRGRFPGGETFLEMQTRLVNEIEAICAAHKPNDLIACFLHSDPIMVIVAHYIGLPLENFARLTVDTGSVTILAIGKTRARLVALNLKPPFTGYCVNI